MTSAGGRPSPWQAADGNVGRVVTWPSPDAFVLVDGVLLRALPRGDGVVPGAGVRLRYDAALGRLVALPLPEEESGE